MSVFYRYLSKTTEAQRQDDGEKNQDENAEENEGEKERGTMTNRMNSEE